MDLIIEYWEWFFRTRKGHRKAVIKEVDIDPQTGKRKTAGTVVF